LPPVRSGSLFLVLLFFRAIGFGCPSISLL
jgi:hypothetical protein